MKKSFSYQSDFPSKGLISITSPSNIALVKYWGKMEDQIPCNPSISFTLQKSVTEMSLQWVIKEYPGPLRFFLDDFENKKFAERIEKYFIKIKDLLPFLTNMEIVIRAKNSFPHSVGIASSASSFSALGIILSKLNHLVNPYDSVEKLLSHASNLSRLGSGSACRSVFGGFNIWGMDDISLSKASRIENVHKVFHDLQDAILIVDSTPKKVSSSEGHRLMQNHIYATKRFEQANANARLMLDVLKSGDLIKFGEIVEEEALSLHGLMMTSRPNYILLRPNTLRILELIRNCRSNNKLPIYFTMDAGPNIHLLYPKSVKKEVVEFIDNNLVKYCERNRWIDDCVGEGPQVLL